MPFVEFLPTPVGFLKIEADYATITSIAFVKEADENRPGTLTHEACHQLSEYVEGQRKTFQLPLANIGSAFQQQVWALVTEIPFGTTQSYHQLAMSYGDAKAIRAVAGANAKNPFALVVPCHRVLGANGTLTGYAWGLERKKWLLQHEGALPETLF